MKIKILGHTIRCDNSLMRFSVEFSDLNQTGSYGVQLKLPATIKQLKDAIKIKYKEIQKQIDENNALRIKYAQFIDKEFDLV